MTPRSSGNSRIRPTVLREALLIGSAAIVLAIAVWFARPDRLPLHAQAEIYELELAAPVIPVAEAIAIYTAGTHLFVDVREGGVDGQIPGAFRVRSSVFDADLAKERDFLYPEDHLILYDDGVMQVAGAAAIRFLERGYSNVTILQGGLTAWRAGGGPWSGEAEHAP